MPWQETSPMDQRERFIQDHRLDLYTMAELCARYSVSRKTGYKWLDRFEEDGRTSGPCGSAGCSSGTCASRMRMGDCDADMCNPCPRTRLLPISPTVHSDRAVCSWELHCSP